MGKSYLNQKFTQESGNGWYRYNRSWLT